MKSQSTYDPFPAVDHISGYLKGQLPAEEAAAVKSAAASSALVSDALEGFAMQPDAIGMVPPVSELTQTLAASKTAAGLGKFFLWKLNTIFAIISVGAGVAAVVGYFMLKDEAVGSPTAEYQIEKKIEEPIVESSAPAEVVVLMDTAAKAMPRTEMAAAVSETLNHNDVISVEKSARRNVETLAALLPETRSLQPMPATAMMPVEASRVAVLVTNYNGLRVADYTPLRSAHWVLPNGSSVGYMEYLHEALNLYLQGKYEQSSLALTEILEAYPEDVNAQYYLAMNALLVGKYEHASDLFERASDNRISSFRHEAHFYRGKCLAQMGKTDEAKQIFQRTIRRGGNLKELALREME